MWSPSLPAFSPFSCIQVGYDAQVRARKDDLVIGLNARTKQVLMYEVGSNVLQSFSYD